MASSDSDCHSEHTPASSCCQLQQGPCREGPQDQSHPGRGPCCQAQARKRVSRQLVPRPQLGMKAQHSTNLGSTGTPPTFPTPPPCTPTPNVGNWLSQIGHTQRGGHSLLPLLLGIQR